MNYNTLIQKNVMRNIDNKIHLKNQKQSMKALNSKKFKSGFHGVSIDGQQNLTARESQISNGTLPYNVSQGQRDSHKTNQTNATQKYQIGRLGLGTVPDRVGGMAGQHAHSSHVFNFDNEINQNNLDMLSNNSSTRRTVRGSEKFNIGK